MTKKAHPKKTLKAPTRPPIAKPPQADIPDAAPWTADAVVLACRQSPSWAEIQKLINAELDNPGGDCPPSLFSAIDSTWDEFFSADRSAPYAPGDVLSAIQFWMMFPTLYWSKPVRGFSRGIALSDHTVAENIIMAAAEQEEFDCSSIAISGKMVRHLFSIMDEHPEFKTLDDLPKDYIEMGIKHLPEMKAAWAATERVLARLKTRCQAAVEQAADAKPDSPQADHGTAALDSFADVEGLPAEIRAILKRGDFTALSDDEIAKVEAWLKNHARPEPIKPSGFQQEALSGVPDPVNAKARRMDEANERLRIIRDYNTPRQQSAAPQGAPVTPVPLTPTPTGTSGHMSKQARALAVKTEHPDWTDAQVAEVAGCHVKSLYRWKLFTMAKDVLKNGKTDFPTGRKPKEEPMEAWEDEDKDRNDGES